MIHLRDLAEDLVHLMVLRLHGETDPVWEFEDDYVNAVLEVENKLNDRFNEISQNHSVVDRSA
jgi:hypothetical protein